jgi:hypothetical protein
VDNIAWGNNAALRDEGIRDFLLEVGCPLPVRRSRRGVRTCRAIHAATRTRAPASGMRAPVRPVAAMQEPGSLIWRGVWNFKAWLIQGGYNGPVGRLM